MTARASWVVAGTTVLVPAEVAALLVQCFDLDGLRAELEPEDREMAEVLASLTAVGRMHGAKSFRLPEMLPEVAAELPEPGNACVPPPAHVGSPGDVDPPAGWVPLEDAAQLGAVPVRTLRYQCARGRVPAVKVAGAWWLDPDAVTS